MIMMAMPTRTAGDATQTVTQSLLPRTCDQMAAARDMAAPASMTSLPTRSRSMNSGVGANSKKVVRSNAMTVTIIAPTTNAAQGNDLALHQGRTT